MTPQIMSFLYAKYIHPIPTTPQVWIHSSITIRSQSSSKHKAGTGETRGKIVLDHLKPDNKLKEDFHFGLHLY